MPFLLETPKGVYTMEIRLVQLIGTINWAMGGNFNSWSDNFNIVEKTPVDGLIASQANSQTFMATSSYRTICAQITNYATIKSNADGGGEGSQAIGYYMSSHPFLDNNVWTALSLVLALRIMRLGLRPRAQYFQT
jgi:hypothetical protein